MKNNEKNKQSTLKDKFKLQNSKENETLIKMEKLKKFEKRGVGIISKKNDKSRKKELMRGKSSKIKFN